tara:strand:+ start:2057 stop:2227 length:171 start_codon:yes stop_codon:yes gene_type:complete
MSYSEKLDQILELLDFLKSRQFMTETLLKKIRSEIDLLKDDIEVVRLDLHHHINNV